MTIFKNDLSCHENKRPPIKTIESEENGFVVIVKPIKNLDNILCEIKAPRNNI